MFFFAIKEIQYNAVSCTLVTVQYRSIDFTVFFLFVQ